MAGNITATSKELTSLGGKGVAIRCDHRNDEDVEKIFNRVRDEESRLDILVNDATSFGETPSSQGYDPEEPFWKLPIHSGMRCLELVFDPITLRVFTPLR